MGFFERSILPLFLLRPYRCEACDQRHYDSRFARRSVPREVAGTGLEMGVPEPPTS